MSKKKQIKINIKGNIWNLVFKDKECDLLGFTDPTIKQITIYSHKEYAKHCKNINKLIKRTLRHELTHAFLYECGLSDCINIDDCGHDEQMVDWFANIYPDYSETLFNLFNDLQQSRIEVE